MDVETFELVRCQRPHRKISMRSQPGAAGGAGTCRAGMPPLACTDEQASGHHAGHHASVVRETRPPGPSSVSGATTCADVTDVADVPPGGGSLLGPQAAPASLGSQAAASQRYSRKQRAREAKAWLRGYVRAPGQGRAMRGHAGSCDSVKQCELRAEHCPSTLCQSISLPATCCFPSNPSVQKAGS